MQQKKNLAFVARFLTEVAVMRASAPHGGSKNFTGCRFQRANRFA